MPKILSLKKRFPRPEVGVVSVAPSPSWALKSNLIVFRSRRLYILFLVSGSPKNLYLYSVSLDCESKLTISFTAKLTKIG